MNKTQASDQEEIIAVLADDIRSYGKLCEAINERASDLGSLALTENIKGLLVKEFGLSTNRPIQLQLKHSHLSKACRYIKECRVPQNIINMFQPS